MNYKQQILDQLSVTRHGSTQRTQLRLPGLSTAEVNIEIDKLIECGVLVEAAINWVIDARNIRTKYQPPQGFVNELQQRG